MTREEFQARAKRPVTDTDYKEIEYVYTFHPSISEVEGKEQIASLYDTFGMRIIRDMTPTAKKSEELQNEIRLARLKLEALTEEYKSLKEGARNE